MNRTLLFVVNVDWFFVSHRLPIALEAIKQGYRVHLACKFTGRFRQLSSMGINLHPLPLSRGGTGPGAEVETFRSILQIIRKIRPDIVHSVTIKPVVYAGIACRLTGVPGRVASVSGLGYVFVSRGVKAFFLRCIVSAAYFLALRGKKTMVVLQNSDDLNLLQKIGILSREQAFIIRGSGVSLENFSYVPEPDGMPVVVMASRLLRDKGVREFVQAADILKKKGLRIIFRHLGGSDPDNPACIPESDLEVWKKLGHVQFLGHRHDIVRQYAQASIVCLPSYREGLPKVLQEAAACGRAVVTTDVPGCRDAVVPGKTGLLVPVRDAGALADAIQRLANDPKLRKKMGLAGRRLAEQEYAVEKVVSAHMRIYNELVKIKGPVFEIRGP